MLNKVDYQQITWKLYRRIKDFRRRKKDIGVSKTNCQDIANGTRFESELSKFN